MHFILQIRRCYRKISPQQNGRRSLNKQSLPIYNSIIMNADNLQQYLSIIMIMPLYNVPKYIISFSLFGRYKRNIYQASTYNKFMQADKSPSLFTEGYAKILTSYLQKNAQDQTIQNQVFYNPVQVFNRDFSVLMMQGYIDLLQKEKIQKFKGVTIADCLSASGLRTIRYLKELKGVECVYANDLLPAAHKLMQDNFDLNELDPSKYKLTLKDANVLMRQNRFDIIDLDPYGSAVPFLDAAVSSIKEGGMLCITCTDTRVLCGPDLVKCYYYYGTTRAKVHDFNENALRILLSTISSTASRHCKYIEPLFSLQTDFYVRIFLRVFSGKRECGESGSKIGNIYNCEACGNYEYQPFFKAKNNHFVPERNICSAVSCPICSHPFQLNGPVWLDQINNHSFIKDMLVYLNGQNMTLPLSTKRKINGVLQGIIAEGEMAKIPLAFNFDLMNKTLHSVGLSKKALLSAVKSLGQQNTVTASYLSPGLYKSNLPLTAIYDIIKAYKLKEMGNEKYLSNVASTYALNILKKEATYKPDLEFKSEEKFNQIPRFISMGKGMGPKGKAGRKIVQNIEQKQQQPKQNADIVGVCDQAQQIEQTAKKVKSKRK